MYRFFSLFLSRLIKKTFTPKIVNELLIAFDEFKVKELASKFGSLGENYHIKNVAYIGNAKYIKIGNNFSSWYNLRIEAIDEYMDQKFNPIIIIGDNVNIGSDCHIGCINQISIGNNVLMAGRVFITDHFHGNISSDDLCDTPSKRRLYSKGPVIIGDNVWIGEGVCIMPGVTIEKNSIIGANAVVTKSCEANSVLVGNPAKMLKKI